MLKRKLILRLIVSPFILGLLLCTYTFGCLKHWIKFIRFGGEWLTYEKEDPKRMEHIFQLLKDQHKESNICTDTNEECKHNCSGLCKERC